MTSCSSRERPSTHPYHDEQHQSQTSLQSTERWRTLFSQIMGTYKAEDLPPLPEGICLSSSSPPPTLPALPCTLFDLPPPFRRMNSLNKVYDTSWAQAIRTAPSPPIMGTSLPGMEGYMLHQPQPHLIPATSGIISSFHTALPPSKKWFPQPQNPSPQISRLSQCCPLGSTHHPGQGAFTRAGASRRTISLICMVRDQAGNRQAAPTTCQPVCPKAENGSRVRERAYRVRQLRYCHRDTPRGRVCQQNPWRKSHSLHPGGPT